MERETLRISNNFVCYLAAKIFLFTLATSNVIGSPPGKAGLTGSVTVSTVRSLSKRSLDLEELCLLERAGDTCDNNGPMSEIKVTSFHFNFTYPLRGQTAAFVQRRHNYATRSASTELLQIPSLQTNIRKFCPSVIGRYFWNDIPPNIRTKPYKKLFKKTLLKFYFSQY